jgi:hypothetical protein
MEAAVKPLEMKRLVPSAKLSNATPFFFMSHQGMHFFVLRISRLWSYLCKPDLVISPKASEQSFKTEDSSLDHNTASPARAVIINFNERAAPQVR